MEVGVLKKVDHSDWAIPLLVVPKGNGKVRLCGDYKVTVNSALTIDQYPLPRPSDLFATLAGGNVFTKLDLSNAYNQLQVDDQSRKYLTINTHRGLFSYTRFPSALHQHPPFFKRL